MFQHNADGRTEQAKTRLTPAEREWVAKAARKRRMSEAQYLRVALQQMFKRMQERG